MRASPCHAGFVHTDYIGACSSGAFTRVCLGGSVFLPLPWLPESKGEKERKCCFSQGAQMAKLALHTSTASGLRSTTPCQITKTPSAMPTQYLPVPRTATQSEQDVEHNCLSSVFRAKCLLWAYLPYPIDQIACAYTCNFL